MHVRVKYFVKNNSKSIYRGKAGVKLFSVSIWNINRIKDCGFFFYLIAGSLKPIKSMVKLQYPNWIFTFVGLNNNYGFSFRILKDFCYQVLKKFVCNFNLNYITFFFFYSSLISISNIVSFFIKNISGVSY